MIFNMSLEAEEALAPPEFGVSEKRADRERYSSNVPTKPITITRIFPHWPMEQI